MMTLSMAENRSRNINQIIADNGKKLFRFIRSRTKTNADAEDILQDVWVQLSNVVDIENFEQVSSWLYRVARNRITDNYRKKKPELIIDDDERNAGIGSGNFLDVLPEIEDEELKEIFWEALFDALEELPEEQRNAFVWNELEEKTFREMEEKTGISAKTWISRKGYAVKHLRNRLEGVYSEFFE